MANLDVFFFFFCVFSCVLLGLSDILYITKFFCMFYLYLPIYSSCKRMDIKKHEQIQNNTATYLFYSYFLMFKFDVHDVSLYFTLIYVFV